jgi:hypothetical protein
MHDSGNERKEAFPWNLSAGRETVANAPNDERIRHARRRFEPGTKGDGAGVITTRPAWPQTGYKGA